MELPPKLSDTVARLAALPGVRAVSLGGSRASGLAAADADWDLHLWHDDGFELDRVRALGLPGEVFDHGGPLGRGAWTRLDRLALDLHFRSVDDLARERGRAARGEFEVFRMPPHLVGVASSSILGEAAEAVLLAGELGRRPEYPEALRLAARDAWWADARAYLDYARAELAHEGRVAKCLGSLAAAALATSHAVLAARGEWVTSEKRILDRAGLRGIDVIVSRASQPDSLVAACVAVDALCSDAMQVRALRQA